MVHHSFAKTCGCPSRNVAGAGGGGDIVQTIVVQVAVGVVTPAVLWVGRKIYEQFTDDEEKKKEK